MRGMQTSQSSKNSPQHVLEQLGSEARMLPKPMWGSKAGEGSHATCDLGCLSMLLIIYHVSAQNLMKLRRECASDHVFGLIRATGCEFLLAGVMNISGLQDASLLEVLVMGNLNRYIKGRDLFERILCGHALLAP